ncbi:MAG: penicillin-binding protein activator [Alphaproteobacteria bacterium]|nr:penicillin-binding protein activator [Alphaproteobacteria bacterium]
MRRLFLALLCVSVLGACAATPKKLPQDTVARQTVPLVPGPAYYQRGPSPLSSSSPLSSPGASPATFSTPQPYGWRSHPSADYDAAPHAPTGNAAPAGLKVGLLVPLSGKSAALGQAMQNAAQLAVMESGADLNLLPRDSGETAASAETALRSVMAEGAQLVVGPLYGAQARAIRATAAAAQMPVLSFSNDPAVAGNGMYALGFNPGEQIMAVMDYAASRGAKNVSALLPANSYGGLVEVAYMRAIKQFGMNDAGVVRYGAGAAGLAKALVALVAKKDAIDTLVLPESGNFSTSLMAQLTAQGFDFSRITVLGSGQWEDVAPEKLAAGTRAWYAAPDDGMRRRFVGQYQNTFGAAPPRLASLAYDAVAMLGALSRMGRPLEAAQFQTAGGFDGVDGLFRLTAGGLAERRLSIYEITPSGFHKVKDAGGF